MLPHALQSKRASLHFASPPPYTISSHAHVDTRTTDSSIPTHIHTHLHQEHTCLTGVQERSVFARVLLILSPLLRSLLHDLLRLTLAYSLRQIRARRPRHTDTHTQSRLTCGWTTCPLPRSCVPRPNTAATGSPLSHAAPFSLGHPPPSSVLVPAFLAHHSLGRLEHSAFRQVPLPLPFSASMRRWLFNLQLTEPHNTAHPGRPSPLPPSHPSPSPRARRRAYAHAN